MGLGSTAKKLQKMADLSQELYGRVNELREQIVGVRDSVDETNERVSAIEAEMAEQRALLEALASEQGVDVEEVAATAAEAEDAAGDETDAAGGETDASADDGAAVSADDAPAASQADGDA